MIQTYTLDQSEKWDHVVKSFYNYDVYYLSGYVKAFQLNGDGQPLLISYCGDGTRAINVVMKRDVADDSFFAGKVERNTYYDLTTPYGYGGFLVEGEDTESLYREYQEFCDSYGIVSEFVRFHPLLENWKTTEKIYDTVHLGDTVCLDTGSESAIWENFTSKNRNMVRKAQKNDLHVFWGRDPELIPAFMETYNATMTKDGAEDYYYFDQSFYESILVDLKQNAMWFYAKAGKDIAAIAIFLFCNGKMHYHLSASQQRYQSLAPTNLVIYEAAVWAAHHGYNRLHLGGGVGSGHDSLYAFKKAFYRGDDTEFHIGKRVWNQRAYDTLCQMRGVEPTEEGFFPRYRGGV